MAEAEGVGVNAVDVSPETVAHEWDEIAAETGAVSEAAPAAAAPVEEDRAQFVPRLTGSLSFAFGLIGNIWLRSWALTREEIDRLGLVWSRVLVKYLPVSWLSKVPDAAGGGECVECDAVLATIEIAGPRLRAAANDETTPAAPAAPGVAAAVRDPHSMPDVFGNKG